MDKVLRHAEILLLKTELLIETCDGWLSPEEGLKNVAKRISEREKTKILARLARWTRLPKFVAKKIGNNKQNQKLIV